MSDSNGKTAPDICILGYGRLAEALAGAARSSLRPRQRLRPDGCRRKARTNVHFFNGNVREAIHGARFILAVTSYFASIIDILRDIDDLGGKTFVQISNLLPSQSVAVEKEVKARQGGYVENPVLAAVPEARSRKA